MLILTMKFSKVVDTQTKEKSRWIFANCGAMLPVVVALAYKVESQVLTPPFYLGTRVG